MFTFHLFFFFCCHLCVTLAVSALIIYMRLLLSFPRRWSLNLWRSPLMTAWLPSSPFSCSVFSRSTADVMKAHVHCSSQHLASVLARSSVLLLATRAGTTATKKARHSPLSSAGSQARHCPGFTAWWSALEYTLRSLCAPNYVGRKSARLSARTHEASSLRGLFIHLLSGSEVVLAGAARWRPSPSSGISRCDSVVHSCMCVSQLQVKLLRRTQEGWNL